LKHSMTKLTEAVTVRDQKLKILEVKFSKLANTNTETKIQTQEDDLEALRLEKKDLENDRVKLQVENRDLTMRLTSMMSEAQSAANKPPEQAEMNRQVEALQEELRRTKQQLEKSAAARAGADMRSEGEQDDLRSKNAKLSSELVEARQQVLETARLRAENDTLTHRLEVAQEQMRNLRTSKPNGSGSNAVVSAESELVNSKGKPDAPRLKLSMPARVGNENVLPKTGQSSSSGTDSQDRRQDGHKKDPGKGASRFENTLFGSMKGKKK